MTNKNLHLRYRLAFAMKGIRDAWKKEKSLRLQSLAALCLLLFCCIEQLPLSWCAVFAVMTAMVRSLELVNSAVEALLDRLHPGQDELIRFAKDCLAGAVLVASSASASIFALYLCGAFSR